MKTVLVVDDSEVVLELTRLALEKGGYRVVTRDRPSGSVAAILRDKPDVVLLDVNMPTLSGDVIAKILVRVLKNPETTVLLHSSMPIDSLRLKALATGAHGYIQKTDNGPELVRRIEYWLNKGRLSSGRMEAAAVVGGAPASSSGSSPSSGRFEAAPFASGSGAPPPRSPSSAGRLAAAPAASAPPAARSPASASRFEAASPSPSSAAPKSPSSGRFEAASPLPGQRSPSANRMDAVSPQQAGPLPGQRSPSSNRMDAVSPASGAPPGARGSLSSGSMRAARRPNEPAPRGGVRVLFVDDDWSMLNTYRSIAGSELSADFVTTGDEAFNRLLSDDPPQLVVSDIMMPGLSGAELYRRALSLDPSWSRRFLFVTGAASTRTVAEFINEVDVRVFHKPVSPERLMEAVRQMADGSVGGARWR